MTVYQKTMREALEEMSQYLNESNLEKMRKAAGGAKQTLKMKDGSIGMDSFSASAIMQIYDKINDKNKKTFEKMMKDGSVVMDSFSASAIMQIYDKINDKNKKTFENMMKNGKKADIMKLQKFAMSKVNASYEEFGEEFALDEAKYELYHKDFSSAMQHAYKMAKKLHGITISPDEISDKVATGPRKPSEGKTNKYRLEGDKGGIQIQVYNKGGSKPFELNMYKEEVELDEAVKVGDTVKVKLNRKGKEYIEKGKVTKIEKDSIIVKHDFSRTPSRVSMKNIVKEEVELDEKKAVSESDQVSRDADKMTADAKVKVGGAVSGATAGLEKSLALKAQKNIDPADIDTSATDDDIKAADKNIMMQLRKSVSLRGQFPVEFLDKKKVKIPQKIAQAALTKYNSLKKPMDKEKFQSKIAKSHRDLLMALKEDIDEMKMTFGTKRIPAAMKKKGMDKVKTPGMAKDKSAGAYIGKMKKESTLERMNKKLQERQDG